MESNELMDSELSYQDRKGILKEKLNIVAESFVIIGYQLKKIRDGELYKIDGYDNINDFAKEQYNLSQPTTSRFIAINNKYSLDGSSPRLLDQYEGFGFSKLSEMLTLSDDEMKLVVAKTTVAEIKEIKKVKREVENEIYATSHKPESLDNAQFEGDSNNVIKRNNPDLNIIVKEFFRDVKNRNMLVELKELYQESSKSGEEIAREAAVIVNPSEHYMFRRGTMMVFFEAEIIKYHVFAGPTVEYTYSDLLSAINAVFNMGCKDPWVEFYGEPPVVVKETPKPEQKQTPKKLPEQKVTKKAEKTTVKPQSEDEDEEDETEDDGENGDIEEEDIEEEINDEIITGQMKVNDYPEILPDQEKIQEEINLVEELEEETAEDVEIAEIIPAPQVVETKLNVILPEEIQQEEKEEEKPELAAGEVIKKECPYCKPLFPQNFVTDNYFISIKHNGFIEIYKKSNLLQTTDRSEIDLCPKCGRKLREC